MWHRFMSAAFAVHVAYRMAVASVGLAVVGVLVGNFDHALVKVVAMRAMQVPVVQIIRMVPMLDRRMAATFTVDVGMQFMKFMMMTHENAFSSTIRVTLT